MRHPPRKLDRPDSRLRKALLLAVPIGIGIACLIGLRLVLHVDNHSTAYRDGQAWARESQQLGTGSELDCSAGAYSSADVVNGFTRDDFVAGCDSVLHP